MKLSRPDLWNKISNLNFMPIKAKLISDLDWPSDKADDIEIKYRSFLYASECLPGKSLSPTAEIDEFWHAHILDTKRYISECLQVFGHYKHHRPFYPGEDITLEVDQLQEILEFYYNEFGRDDLNIYARLSKHKTANSIDCSDEDDGSDSKCFDHKCKSCSDTKCLNDVVLESGPCQSDCNGCTTGQCDNGATRAHNFWGINKAIETTTTQ